MEVHSYDPYLPLAIAKKAGVTMHKNVDNLFKTCTHISIHCNLTDETHHLVNQKRISMMPGVDPFNLKCGNHVVNCARGGIVDEDAAFEHLSLDNCRPWPLTSSNTSQLILIASSSTSEFPWYASYRCCYHRSTASVSVLTSSMPSSLFWMGVWQKPLSIEAIFPDHFHFSEGVRTTLP